MGQGKLLDYLKSSRDIHFTCCRRGSFHRLKFLSRSAQSQIDQRRTQRTGYSRCGFFFFSWNDLLASFLASARRAGNRSGLFYPDLEKEGYRQHFPGAWKPAAEDERSGPGELRGERERDAGRAGGGRHDERHRLACHQPVRGGSSAITVRWLAALAKARCPRPNDAPNQPSSATVTYSSIPHVPSSHSTTYLVRPIRLLVV